MSKYIIIALGVLLVFLISVGGIYFTYAENRIENLVTDNSRLEIANKTNVNTIEELETSFEEISVANQTLQENLQKAEKYGDDLRKKLNDHDLTNLSIKKPGLIEKRINDATNSLFEALESDTRN